MHVSTVSSSFLFIQPIAFQIYQRQPFEPRHLCTVLYVYVCLKPMSANAPSGNASIAGIKMRRTSRLRACPLQSLCVDARFVNRWGLCLSIHLASPRLSSPLLSSALSHVFFEQRNHVLALCCLNSPGVGALHCVALGAVSAILGANVTSGGDTSKTKRFPPPHCFSSTPLARAVDAAIGASWPRAW